MTTSDQIAAPDRILRGGRLVDAHGEHASDVAISGGVITAIGELGSRAGWEDVDCSGCVITPGFVDLHTHLREPGREDAETIETGARAAASGGYTAVLAMPNTEPAMDCAEVIRSVLDKGRSAICDVYASGAITVGRAGEQLSPMAEMAALGVRVFTDDGTGVQDDRLMRRAMEYALDLGVTLAQHCEVTSLSEGTCMHEGAWSSRLGLPGQPAEAEELMVMRDVALVRKTGAKMHFLHLSTAGSVAIVKAAKAGGLPVTAEAAPHHFSLTDAMCAGYDPTFKVHPPLRTDADVAAVKAGLADGTIDAIATDHAPHTPESKELPFDQAPPGMLGLEFAFALANTNLGLPLHRLVDLLSTRPAAIAGVSDRHGMIAEGRPANLAVLDPMASWTVDASGGASKSRNVPYVGMALNGRIRHTFLDGERVVADGVATR